VMRWPPRHRVKAQSRRFNDAMVGAYERVSPAYPGLSADCVSRDDPRWRWIDGRAGAAGFGTGRLGGLRKEGDVSQLARGARGEPNLPWLEAHDRVGSGFLVQQPCATDAVPW